MWRIIYENSSYYLLILVGLDYSILVLDLFQEAAALDLEHLDPTLDLLVLVEDFEELLVDIEQLHLKRVRVLLEIVQVLFEALVLRFDLLVALRCLWCY